MRPRKLAATALLLLALPLGTAQEQGQGDVVRLPQETEFALNAVAWHPSGDFALIVGGRTFGLSKLATVLDTDGLDTRVTFETGIDDSTNPVLIDVAFHPSGKYAIAIGKENVVMRITGDPHLGYRYENLWTSGNLQDFTFLPRSISWRPQGDYALITGNGLVKWDGREFEAIDAGDALRFNTVQWEPGGKYALIDAMTLDDEGHLQLGRILRFDHADPPTLGYVGNFGNEGSTAYAIGFTRDGKRALLGGFFHAPPESDDPLGRFVLYDSTVGRVGSLSKAPMSHPQGRITGIHLRPGGNTWIVSAELAPALMETDGVNLTPVYPIGLRLLDVAWHPRGDYAFAVGIAGEMARYTRFHPPLATLTAPKQDEVVYENFTFRGKFESVNFTTPIGRVQLRLDGGPWLEPELQFHSVKGRVVNSSGAWLLPYDTRQLADGPHTVEVQALALHFESDIVDRRFVVANTEEFLLGPSVPILVEGPDAHGNFTLEWIRVGNPRTTYVVQESPILTFGSNATEVFNGTGLSVRLTRAEGDFFYRLRAFTSVVSSNWTLPVLINVRHDDDEDGCINRVDRFPTDASECKDTDGDGVGDNADAFPDDPTEQRDADGDLVGDGSDAFPEDALDSKDTDADGFGDNRERGKCADPFDAASTPETDDDGDGFFNEEECAAGTATRDKTSFPGAKPASGGKSPIPGAGALLAGIAIVLVAVSARRSQR